MMTKYLTNTFLFLLLILSLFAGCLDLSNQENTISKNIRGTDITAGTPLRKAWLSSKMQKCNERGYVWIALVNKGKSPTKCGEPLANFLCIKTELLKRFANFKTEINNLLDQMKDFRLYNCGYPNNHSVSLHFIKIEQNTTYYKSYILEFNKK